MIDKIMTFWKRILYFFFPRKRVRAEFYNRHQRVTKCLDSKNQLDEVFKQFEKQTTKAFKTIELKQSNQQKKE